MKNKRKTSKGKKISLKKTSDSQPVMKNWENDGHRLDAKTKFVQELEADHDALEYYRTHPAEAKTRFAHYGPFYEQGKLNKAYPPFDPKSGIKPIPKKTVFRIFRNGLTDRLVRDEQVVLIVNPDGNKKEPLGEAQVWRCSYTPY